MKEGIPSQDIIWYNISKLLVDDKLSRMIAFTKPLFYSVILTVFILCLERTCELMWPLFSPFFF